MAVLASAPGARATGRPSERADADLSGLIGPASEGDGRQDTPPDEHDDRARRRHARVEAVTLEEAKAALLAPLVRHAAKAATASASLTAARTSGQDALPVLVGRSQAAGDLPMDGTPAAASTLGNLREPLGTPQPRPAAFEPSPVPFLAIVPRYEPLGPADDHRSKAASSTGIQPDEGPGSAADAARGRWRGHAARFLDDGGGAFGTSNTTNADIDRSAGGRNDALVGGKGLARADRSSGDVVIARSRMPGNAALGDGFARRDAGGGPGVNGDDACRDDGVRAGEGAGGSTEAGEGTDGRNPAKRETERAFVGNDEKGTLRADEGQRPIKGARPADHTRDLTAVGQDGRTNFPLQTANFDAGEVEVVDDEVVRAFTI